MNRSSPPESALLTVFLPNPLMATLSFLLLRLKASAVLDSSTPAEPTSNLLGNPLDSAFKTDHKCDCFSSSLPLSLLPGSLQQLVTPASTLLLQCILMSSQFIYWKYKTDQVTPLTQTRQCLSISFSANFKVLPMACKNTLFFTFLTSSPTSLHVHSAPDTLPFLIFLERSQIDSCLLILALLFHLPAVLFP